VSPLEAWEILASDKFAVLVDVRTLPEWSFVGVPDLSSIEKNVIFLSWRIYPTMAINNEFCTQLSKIIADVETPIFFICRSGHRSMDAAVKVTQYGYKNCYNVLGGFEGDVDEQGHRAQKNGWKLYNLPWGQN
jgi:rhodanese-related sulfurtransferase